MKIKICGITNLEDAQKCINIGVDFLGFIFYKKSPRFIEYPIAREIIDNLDSNISKVGVFVNEDIKRINEISKKLGLDYVQLHGNEDSEYVDQIELPCIKAINGNSPNLYDTISNYQNAEYLLLDNISKDLKGGSGKKFDWDNIKKISNKNNIILSGGLSNENIIEAISRTKINFYDFCSSTESKPGIKNIKKIETIVNLIRNAEKQN